MTADQLLAFEQRVVDAFREKRIRAPVHLCSDTQIAPLIELFQNVQPQDYVFSGWRSHYHALLKGIPEEWVFNEILAGRSMYLMNREHRFISSAIVGGILPIACGVALAESFKPDPATRSNVWVFVGDMTARAGVFHEFYQFCCGHNLPVQIVVEDNGFSTDTPTKEAWGTDEHTPPIHRYSYQRTRPHVGTGEHVGF